MTRGRGDGKGQFIARPHPGPLLRGEGEVRTVAAKDYGPVAGGRFRVFGALEELGRAHPGPSLRWKGVEIAGDV